MNGASSLVSIDGPARQPGNYLSGCASARESFRRAVLPSGRPSNRNRAGSCSELLGPLCLCVGLSLLTNGPLLAAQPLGRPVSGNGPEARTLVVFSNTGLAYSLGNELEFLKLQ